MEPIESNEHRADQEAIPNLNASWVNSKGAFYISHPYLPGVLVRGRPIQHPVPFSPGLASSYIDISGQVAPLYIAPHLIEPKQNLSSY